MRSIDFINSCVSFPKISFPSLHVGVGEEAMRLRLVQELLDENEKSHNAGRETNAAKNNVQCSEVNCHD